MFLDLSSPSSISLGTNAIARISLERVGSSLQELEVRKERLNQELYEAAASFGDTAGRIMLAREARIGAAVRAKDSHAALDEARAQLEERMRGLLSVGAFLPQAYRIVQRNAKTVWEDGADFLEALLADKDVTKALSPETIRAQFDLGYHLKHVDTIFKRVFGKS